MPILTITNDEGRETLKMDIAEVDPELAVPEILASLRAVRESQAPVPKPRKPRSDKGHPRKADPQQNLIQ